MKIEHQLLSARLFAIADSHAEHAVRHDATEGHDHGPSISFYIGALLGIKMALKYPDIMQTWFDAFLAEAPADGGLLDADFVVTGIPEEKEVGRGKKH